MPRFSLSVISPSFQEGVARLTDFGGALSARVAPLPPQLSVEERAWARVARHLWASFEKESQQLPHG